MLKKSLDSSRTLLFGLLVNCPFPTNNKEECPLWDQRYNLSIEQKYKYAMEISDKKVRRILDQHEFCYEKRFPELSQW
jgi:hypothetical protein